MLSASAHKFNGPKGIGFLYVRQGVALPAYADGGYQEYSLRAGTENIASIVGMSKALKNNCDCLDLNQLHLRALERQLIQELDASGISYSRLGGKNTLPGLISLSFPKKDGEAILHRMDLKGICISTGSACDSKRTQVSHVLSAINLDRSLAEGTIRISLGKNNTKEDVSMIAATLISIVR